jgi:hypothetical protein
VATAMVKVVCECGCGKPFMARKADRDRGWGRFASKQCKAREQERRTGQYKRLLGESGDIDELDRLGLTDEDFGHFPGDL